MLRAIPGTLMRGGTSKGLYFHASDLPQSARARGLGQVTGVKIQSLGGATAHQRAGNRAQHVSFTPAATAGGR